MEQPLISIIVVSSDSTANHEASFRSCMNQSYTNRELIVVDHGAEGSTKQVLDSLGSNEVTYLPLPHVNREAALNRGIATARGEYILCMDGGAEVHEQWLEKAIQWFHRSGSDAIGCATMYIGGKKSGEVSMPSESPSWYQNLLFSPLFELHAVIVRRDACAIFNEDGQPYADWEFWINTLRDRKLFVWPEYVGSFVHGDKTDPLGGDDPELRMRRLQVMVQYRHEVKGFLQKLKYGRALRSLYREYLQQESSSQVRLDDAVDSCWWAKGLKRS